MRTEHLSIGSTLPHMGASHTGAPMPSRKWQREANSRDPGQRQHGCPPSAAPEEAHPFIQQVFLILSQMGNSSCRIILMYERRVFSVTSHILLFVLSFNNCLLSSPAVLRCSYKQAPVASQEVLPACGEGEGPSCWTKDPCILTPV